jgi:hypothetical protein
MPLPIVTSEMRKSEKKGAKVLLLGASGVGKTPQLYTFNPETTLFIDVEAGDLSVLKYTGDTIRVSTWADMRDLCVFIAGPDAALSADNAFSEAHYAHAIKKFGDPSQLNKYTTFFIDSITQLSRMCLRWAKSHPSIITERGKTDGRAIYGLLANEMISAILHLQLAREKNIIYVAILNEKTDDFGRKYYEAQLEGSKTAMETPGIIDEIIVMANLKDSNGKPYKAFITKADNSWGYPARDRSGNLELLEPPDLHKLIQKCTEVIQ